MAGGIALTSEEDDVLKCLEEAADLIKDAVDGEKPLKPAKPSSLSCRLYSLLRSSSVCLSEEVLIGLHGLL